MLRLLLLRLARRGPFLLLLVGLLSLSLETLATHIRAGDIQSRVSPADATGRRILFTLTLYAREVGSVGGGSPPDQSTAAIFFGDGSCNPAVPRTTNTLIAPDVRRYTYDFEHTYSAPNRYTVSFIGENRNSGVENMVSSDQQSFYISTRIIIDPGLGQNSSPVLRRPAFDFGAVGQVFLHNPDAYDADGDSLAYQLVPSQQAGTAQAVVNCTPAPTPVPGYVLPNNLTPSTSNGVQVPYAGPPAWVPGGTPSIFEINARTGQVTWNSPGKVGEYNFAFAVKAYRRTSRGYRLVDSLVRDMQVRVLPTNNKRPELTIPADICVVAGTPVRGDVTATDPDGHRVRLYTTSTLTLTPPATFTQTSFGPPTATGTFRWTPDCTNIASDPTQVVFNAEDEPPGPNPVPLVDIKVWRITVIGPAPQNLQVTPQANPRRAVLTWNSYICRKPGARIHVYRKEGTSTFNPAPCITGIPASTGFTRIATLTYPAPPNAADLLSFVDDGGGTGLERGKTYCYRIYVEFPRPAGGASLASAEACVDFPGRPLLLRNVTVDRTATSSGQITVRWTTPSSTPAFANPQQYRVLRAVGQTPAATAFTQVGAIINRAPGTNDTTYVDNDPTLDTQNRSYSYKVEFLSNNVVVETAAPAASVRVDGTAVPAVTATDLNTIQLRWAHTVPWDNSLRPTTIYRRGPNLNDPFVAIATVPGTTAGGTYQDQGTATQRLVKGQTYCYYVSTEGTYNVPRLPSGLINLSQQQCIALRTIPCAPVLTLKRPNCDSLASRLFDLPATPISGALYTNSLSWTLGNTPPDCSRAIASYAIYYSPNDQDSLRFLTSVPGTQTSYQHRNLTSEAGCYAVQAVDSSGLRSARSNRECKEDCQLFLLPNIFTPNGDGKNDTFRPKVFTPLRSTRFTVFNRWGVKIYESSSDPLINWTGGGSRGEGGAAPSVVEGVYYYQAEVEFNNVGRTKRTFKGWVEITR